MTNDPNKIPRRRVRLAAPIFSIVLVAWIFAITARAQVATTPSSFSATEPAPTTISSPLFSEDFESGTLNKEIWSQEITGKNIIKVQSDKVAHGKYALQVQCPVVSNRTWAFITTSKLPEALRQHHFGRAYMYIAPAAPVRHTILITSGTSGFPRNKYQEVATANTRWQLTYVNQMPGASEEDYHSAGAMPNNRWFCLEWEFNDHPNHSAMWVDGQPIFETDFVSKANGAKTDLVGGFTDYAFGFRLWGDALAPFDLYFDDIALDTHRIGAIDSPATKPQ